MGPVVSGVLHQIDDGRHLFYLIVGSEEIVSREANLSVHQKEFDQHAAKADRFGN